MRQAWTDRGRALALAWLVLGGCAPPDDVPDTVGDLDPGPEPAGGLSDLAAPPDTFVEAVIPARGGALGHSGLWIFLPPGAVPEGTTVRIVPVAPPPDVYADRQTLLYRIEPMGLELATPARLHFPLEAPATDLQVHGSTSVGGWQPVPDTVVSVNEVGAPIDRFRSVFVAGTGPITEPVDPERDVPIDLLFVVDDSASMLEEQGRLQRDVDVVVEPLLRTGVDWHLGVVTTDLEWNERSGRLVAAGGTRFVSPETSDPLAVTRLLLDVGVGGSRDEEPLGASLLALRTQGVLRGNHGFRREGAQVVLVFVTDEEDQSRASDAHRWSSDVLDAVDRPEDLHVVAIVGLPPSGCASSSASADPAAGLVRLVEEVGGTVHSICSPDWTPPLEAAMAGLDASTCHRLLTTADPRTLDVFAWPSGDALSRDGWRYDAESECLFLTLPGANELGREDLGVRYAPRAD